MTSRRDFLSVPGSAAVLGAAPRPLRITSVKAARFPLLETERFGRSDFKGDHDPARWRWFGPFSQLAGSILVQIRTDAGSRAQTKVQDLPLGIGTKVQDVPLAMVQILPI